MERLASKTPNVLRVTAANEHQTRDQAFFVLSRILLPFYISPGVSPLKVLGAFMVSDAVFSFTFGLISQVRCRPDAPAASCHSKLTCDLPAQASHAVDCVEWPTVDPATGNIEQDWMRLQGSPSPPSPRI